MNDKLGDIISNRRICVVGPSPHLEDSSLGSVIDSYDVICRLNEIFPIGLEKDYGSRSDVLFWNMGCNFMDYFKRTIKENPSKMSEVQLLVCPRHSLHVVPHCDGNFSPERNVFKNYESLEIDTEFFHIGDELNTRFETSIGCHPTIGTLALLTLLEYRLEKLFVCGMSFYKTGKRYHKSVSPDPDRMGKPGHNINREIDFLSDYLKKFSNIDGDQKIKNILKMEEEIK